VGQKQRGTSTGVGSCRFHFGHQHFFWPHLVPKAPPAHPPWSAKEVARVPFAAEATTNAAAAGAWPAATSTRSSTDTVPVARAWSSRRGLPAWPGAGAGAATGAAAARAPGSRNSIAATAVMPNCPTHTLLAASTMFCCTCGSRGSTLGPESSMAMLISTVAELTSTTTVFMGGWGAGGGRVGGLGGLGGDSTKPLGPAAAGRQAGGAMI
jgi:hypothetical protein